MRILYPLGDGIAVLTPNTDCGLTVRDVAHKDVPAGVPYLIVDDAAIPADRTFRDAWEADFSAPDGYGVGPDAWFEMQEALKPQLPEPQLPGVAL